MRGYVSHINIIRGSVIYGLISYINEYGAATIIAHGSKLPPNIQLLQEVEFELDTYCNKIVANKITIVGDSNFKAFLDDPYISIAGTASIISFRISDFIELCLKLKIYGDPQGIYRELRVHGYDYIGKTGKKETSTLYFLHRNC